MQSNNAGRCFEDKRVLSLDSRDFLYGPTAFGKLKALKEKLKCRSINDLQDHWQPGVDVKKITKDVIFNSISHNYNIYFDLTNMKDLDKVIQGTAYQGKITTYELLLIKENYDYLRNNVFFIKDECLVGAPW